MKKVKAIREKRNLSQRKKFKWDGKAGSAALYSKLIKGKIVNELKTKNNKKFFNINKKTVETKNYPLFLQCQL